MRSSVSLLLVAIASIASGVLMMSSCGSSGSSEVKEYIYAANAGQDSVMAFSVHSLTGELALIDEEILEDNSAPTGLAIHPLGGYLYSANTNAKRSTWWGSSTLSTYRIGEEGGLSAVGLPSAVGNGLVNIVFTPSGDRLFGADVFGNTVALDVNYLTGQATEVAASPVASGEKMHGIAMHPSGDYLFVADCDYLNSYVINAQTAGLTNAPGSPVDTIACHVWLELTPDGRYLYAADPDGGIDGYTVNQSTGELTTLSGFPVMTGASYSVKSLAVTPDGAYLYSAQSDTDEIGAFMINSLDGSLSNVPGMPYATGAHPKSVEVERQGRFLYAASFDAHEINAFAINSATGELTSIGNYPAGVNPKMILSSP